MAAMPGLTRASGEWAEVALPGGLAPASLTVADGELWIGGRLPTALPGMAHGAGSTWTAVPIVAESTYARQADLVHVIVDGDSGPKAIGIATGGQHLLPRWTVWSWDGTELVEKDQTFETFGGLSAGGLTDMVATPDGPRILGSWSPQNRYIGIALWSLHGDVWVRDDVAALASTKTFQQLPAALDMLGNRLVIVGNSSSFEPGGNPLSQQAMWVQNGDGWLPWWTTTPTDTSNAILSDVACDTNECFVVGGAKQPSGQWALTVFRATAGETVDSAPEGIPEIPFSVTEPAPVIAAADGAVAVLDHGSGQLLTRRDGEWSSRQRPPGTVLDAKIVGGALYVIIEADAVRTLWSSAI